MDQHGENCNCGEEMEFDHVTLTLDDGSEIVCDVIAIFPCRDKQYIALLPTDAGEDGEVFLYRFVQLDGDEIDLINIEDDEEFEEVSDAFDELLDSEEFEELFEE